MNKNHTRLRKILSKEGSVSVEVPSKGYHNSSKGSFQARRIVKTKYIHVSKRSPFPKPSKANVSMMHQKHLFEGIPCLCNDNNE